MEQQLRVYQVKEGRLEEWVEFWRAQVLPLRRRFGFTVLGPWVVHDESRFVWIVGHGSFSEANAAFYGSAERSALEPEIPKYLENVEAWMLDSVA
ncbi:MAG: NIPSNAP family protein [Gaiellaceae bacterium]